MNQETESVLENAVAKIQAAVEGKALREDMAMCSALMHQRVMQDAVMSNAVAKLQAAVEGKALREDMALCSALLDQAVEDGRGLSV